MKKAFFGVVMSLSFVGIAAAQPQQLVDYQMDERTGDHYCREFGTAALHC